VRFVAGKGFFSRTGKNKPPMTFGFLFEGVHTKLMNGLVAFDIETFSPDGFPNDIEDPIVNFSLVFPLVKGGVLALSVIAEPSLEKEILNLLRRLLLSFRGTYLLTYNGTKFDLEYVARRGEIYGFNFESVFSDFWHIDVYQLIRWLNIRLPRYNQKAVERFLGIPRAVRHVSGSSYHLFYGKFLRGGSLEPMFYNIEDSFGCLRISSALLKFLERRRIVE